MKRKLALAAVLCLAVAAALSIGAVPALAADGCDCHTADPPTAPAAHDPYVASVTDCTTCHVSWTVPHPNTDQRLRLTLVGRSAETGYRLHGRLALRWVDKMGSVLLVGHPDVVVYLQQRLWGATEFTDLTQMTTGAKGGFAFAVVSPVPFATYRAIAQGHVVEFGHTLLFKPKATALLPKPELTIGIAGFLTGALGEALTTRLGRTLTVSGTVAPADLGGNVTIRVERRVQQWWGRYATVKRAVSATGTYSWKFTPKNRGTYRVYVAIPATAAHRGLVVRWRGGAGQLTFTVG